MDNQNSSWFSSLEPLIAQIASNVTNSNPLPFGSDSFQESNPDVNGYYQTVKYFTGGIGGTLIKTAAITYDSLGNILTLAYS